MHKPPLAPKPQLAQTPQRPGLSPSTPRRDVLSLPSPGTPRRVKPVLAPKPCLSKLTTAVESKTLTLKSQTPVTATQRTEGLNSQKEIQQENKKPDWDYIIPICLCSHENCMCIRNTSANIDKKDLKTLRKCAGKTEENTKLLPTSRGTVDTSGEEIITACTNGDVTNHKPPHETFIVDRNLNTDIDNVTVRPSSPHRTWSDEANGNVIPQSAPGRGPEDDALGSEQTSCVPQPKPVSAGPRKPVPVPVPRKLRMSVLTRQEKVEEEREEIISQEGRDMNVKEGKVSLEGKGNSSLSAGVPVEKQPIFLSARKACAMQAPPPRKKPFLSAPEKASTSAPQTLPKDVEVEDLGWDSSSHEMEVSLDKEDEVVEKEKEKEETRDQEAVYTDFTCNQPELSRPPAITVTADDALVKVAPKKPQRESSPMAWMWKNESSEEKEEEKLGDKEKRQTPLIEGCVLKERVMKELPLPPAEKTSRTLLKAGAIKPSRSSLGKQRAKSFSGADLVRSEGQRRNSFRKLLDLKLSVKMFPKLIVKGGQSPDSAANENEQSVDRDQDGCQNFHEHLGSERKFSCPLIGVEQSVDGDEFSPGEEQALYENIPYYEEIPDYINVHVGRAATSSPASFSQPTAWQSPLYNDEGIYEEQEPYMSFEKNPEHQQCQTPTDCER